MVPAQDHLAGFADCSKYSSGASCRASRVRRVLAYPDDPVALHEALVQERDRAFFPEPSRDEDAVAELDEGTGGDPGPVPVFVPPEGGAQDGRQAATDAVEREASHRGVDPCDAGVQVASRRPFVTGFQGPVRGAHRRGVVGELARDGGAAASRAAGDHGAVIRSAGVEVSRRGTGLDSTPEKTRLNEARPGPLAVRTAIVPQRATTRAAPAPS